MDSVSERAVGRAWANDASWLLGANVLRNLGLIVILVFLARLTTPEVVGRYALALAITTPVFTFAQLGIKGIYLTIATRHRLVAYSTLLIASTMVAVLISLVLAVTFFPQGVLTVLIVALIKVADSFAELFTAPLQLAGSTRTVFLAGAVTAILGSMATLSALVMTGSLDASLVALLVVSAAATLLILVIPALRGSSEATNLSHGVLLEWRPLLLAGVPMGLTNSVLALVVALPQYFLAPLHGQASVGIFAVLMYLLAVADIFTGTLTQAWIPSARRAVAAAATRVAFVRGVLLTAGRWTLIFVPLSAAGLLIGAVLLPVMFGAEYALDTQRAIALAIAVLVLPLAHFGSTAVVVRNLYTHSVIASVIAATVVALASAMLVPPFGILGALWATASGLAVRGAISIVILTASRRPLAPSVQPQGIGPE
jgi:O-antigen/teichoic acid export membrane protein